jgi:alpha-ribazole phosphatase
MIQLLTIRHAPVDAEGICYGQSDVPTLLDAREVAQRIRGHVAEHAPVTIWSSDAIRCHRPARLLSDELEVPHRFDPRIRELSYGRWEGRPWSEIPKDEVDQWNVDWLTRAPPDGETVSELADRVASWWRSLEPGAHFLMAHAGVVHCLDVVAAGLSWEQTAEIRLDYLEARSFAAATSG